MADRLVNF